MCRVFPEACIHLPKGFADAFECIPDTKDRHVLAAVKGQANGIVTLNTKDFPDDCMTEYGIIRHHPKWFSNQSTVS
jgi:hypothetical protein